MVNIQSWGLDKIMQLPDHAFGRRYIIFSRQFIGAAASVFWLVKDPLPDRFLLWAIRFGGFVDADTDHGFRFAFGEQDPADEDAFDALRPVFPGDFDDAARKTLISIPATTIREIRLRMPYESLGERFVCAGINGGATSSAKPTVEFEISAIPREVPEWVLCRREESL